MDNGRRLLERFGEKKILTRFNNDEDYFGKLGRNFLSSSDADPLLHNPTKFKVPKEKTKHMIEGSYVHIALFEQDKLPNFLKDNYVDVASRNTSKYRDASQSGWKMIRPDKEKLDRKIKALLDNEKSRELIRGDNVEFEVPLVGFVKSSIIDENTGELVEYEEAWKGKIDFINHDYINDDGSKGVIGDLKTTLSVYSFDKSAYSRNYDVQSFVYPYLINELEGIDYSMKFLSVDPEHRIGIFNASKAMQHSGAIKAAEMMRNFGVWIKKSKWERDNYVLSKNI